MTGTQLSVSFVVDREVQLRLTDFVPRAALARRCRFWNLLQTKDNSIKSLRGRFKFRGHRYVDVMKGSNHFSSLNVDFR